MCTLGSRGYFFLIDTGGSRRSRVNEARSAEEKELLIPTVSTVDFILGILRTKLHSIGPKLRSNLVTDFDETIQFNSIQFIHTFIKYLLYIYIYIYKVGIH